MAMSHRLGLVLLVMLVILATSFYQIQCTDSVQVSIHGVVCSTISNHGNCYLLKRAYKTYNIKVDHYVKATIGVHEACLQEIINIVPLDRPLHTPITQLQAPFGALNVFSHPSPNQDPT